MEALESRPRRRFLNYFLGSSLGAVVVSFLYPIIRFASPPLIPEATTNQVEAGDTSDPAIAPRLRYARRAEIGEPMRARLLAVAAVVILWTFVCAGGAAFAQTSCIHCHGGDLFDDAAKAKVKHFNVYV